MGLDETIDIVLLAHNEGASIGATLRDFYRNREKFERAAADFVAAQRLNADGNLVPGSETFMQTRLHGRCRGRIQGRPLFGRYSDQDELILVYPGQRKGAMRPLRMVTLLASSGRAARSHSGSEDRLHIMLSSLVLLLRCVLRQTDAILRLR